MSAYIQRIAGRADTYEVTLGDREDTERLGALLAAWFGKGDVITLSGDLGAGKTELARALIRAFAGDPALAVQSPTFPIVISYEFTRGRVVHCDLYRIGGDEELDEIGWDELGNDALLLVEWADRAEGRIAADRLDVTLAIDPELGPDGRVALLTAHGTVAQRLLRLYVAEVLVEASGFGGAERIFLQGDASSRSYTRLVGPDSSAILMNSPRKADGPALKRTGVPYSQTVHLAEDVKPFVAMDRALIAQGFSAPAIHAADLEAGLLVIEDLGSEGVVAGDPPSPIKARYEAAMEVLAALHARTLPQVLHVAPRLEYPLPTYDTPAFLAEMDLMLDWYLPSRGIAVDGVVREEFRLLWRTALQPVQAEPKTWVLRDYHSPNLIWLEEREGLRRVGLLDFQDAVLGPAGYDVASLAQDARVDVPEQLELQLLGHYVRTRREADPGFDARAFARSYAVLGAQRATKILGIFTRLNVRDHKPQYLRHIPRIRRYLARCLGHQDLGSLKMWYEAVLPSKDLTP